MFKRIYIEITNACNLNCSFCSKDNRDIKFMRLDEFSRIIQEIKPFTKVIYLHVKGECFLHPLLDDFLSLCDKENIDVNITTNGTLLDINEEKLKHSSIKKINISLNSENNYPQYLEKIITIAKKLSPTKVIIYRLWAQKSDNLDTKSTEFVEKLEKEYKLSPLIVEKIKNEANTKIASNTYVDKAELFDWPTLSLKEQTDGYCYALKTHIAILVDGTVVPCCLDSQGLISLGNIYKEHLSDILKKERTQKIIEGFKNRKPCEELCQHCSYKSRF